MVASESEEKKYTKFEENFLSIGYLSEYVTYLRNTKAKPDKQNIKSICDELFVLKSFEFICKYKTLENYVPENKKYIFEKFQPLFRILSDCEEGLRLYRNKRVAHIDALDVNSEDFFIEYRLPTSPQGFAVLYEIIDILAWLVNSLFFEDFANLSEKIKNQSDSNKQIPRRNFEEELKVAKNEVWSKIREDKSHFLGFTVIKTKLLD